jgi:DNA topoisomerase-1
MRTDSVNLSDTAVNGAKAAIEEFYGNDYSKPTKYTTKSSGAQEAHEAIRPTDFGKTTIDSERDETRLYELIWKRSIASQMAHAKLERTTVKIGGLPTTDYFTAKGEVIIFDGFLKVYMESSLDEEQDEEAEGLLPKVNANESLDLSVCTAVERFTRPPSRYVEASLVKKLEELGIGRPSTYAPTISTIQKRTYVEKQEREGEIRNYCLLTLTKGEISKEEKSETTGKDRNKLFPTDIGIVVTDYLKEHFEQIMDYQFTAKVEAEFDEIAQGRLEWTNMMENFYKPFHLVVENTLEHSERATGERELGVHPESGRKIIVRIGKFGPMVQIGDEKVDGEKALFASLQPNQSIGNISLEDALKLFQLPRVVGQYEDQDMKVNNGRFGPYVQVGKIFASIPKGEDPMSITYERSLEIYLEKLQVEANRLIKSFDERPDIQLLNGRYGPYMKIGKDNFKLPKGTEAEKLSLEECIEISKSDAAKPAKKRAFKKK